MQILVQSATETYQVIIQLRVEVRSKHFKTDNGNTRPECGKSDEIDMKWSERKTGNNKLGTGLEIISQSSFGS